MRRSLAILAGFVAAAALLAPPARAQFSKTLDRRYPASSYCPLDNDSFDLTFTATTDRVKITIAADNLNNFNNWLAHRFDNMAVLPKSLFEKAGKALGFDVNVVDHTTLKLPSYQAARYRYTAYMRGAK